MESNHINVLSEMLVDRGYSELSQANIDKLFSTKESISIKTDAIEIHLEIQNSKGKDSLFSRTEKINSNDIVIFAGRPGFKTSALKKLVHLNRVVSEQCFTLDYFSFNVTKHVMVPTHQVLSEKEKRELYAKLSIVRPEQLPIIFTTDPIAKYLGLKEGNVCKVIRPTSESYRSVQKPLHSMANYS